MQGETSIDSLGQLYSSGSHQQTRGYAFDRTMCTHVDTVNLVSETPGHPESSPHTQVPKCDHGWSFQKEPDPTHRMVPVSPNIQTDHKTLGTSSGGPIPNKTECQTSTICLSNPRRTGMGRRRPQYLMGKSDCVHFPPISATHESGLKTDVTKLQAHSHLSVVLGPVGTITRPSSTDSTSRLSAISTEQPIPQQPRIPESPRLVFRSTSLQNQSFSAEVEDRIAASQRLSTRAIYASKWAVFQHWCIDTQVDFRCLSIGEICNFLWFLFNTKNICPSTIEGYRTAIADTLGNSNMDNSNNADLARLIVSFHRDRPKSARTLPKWDQNLVLHQL